jgi:predicted permease
VAIAPLAAAVAGAALLPEHDGGSAHGLLLSTILLAMLLAPLAYFAVDRLLPSRVAGRGR